MKKDKKKKKSRFTEYCSKCKHDHVAGTGPCTKTGCGCHKSYDDAQPERDQMVKEFMKKKYGKKTKA